MIERGLVPAVVLIVLAMLLAGFGQPIAAAVVAGIGLVLLLTVVIIGK